MAGVTSFFAPVAHLELRLGGPYEMLFDRDALAGSRGSEGCTILSTPHTVLCVTAQGKHYPEQDSAFVFHRCRLTAEPGVKGVFLGRPWRDFARVVFLETEMGGHVEAAGWREWHPGETNRLETAFFAEKGSTGPGARPGARDPHTKALAAGEADRFALGPFLAGADGWSPASRSREAVPYW